VRWPIVASYGPRVPHAASVFSNAQITREQLGWLAGLFGGKQAAYAEEFFDIELGPGILESVGLADGTDDTCRVPELVHGI
jgi:hypothetical protein